MIELLSSCRSLQVTIIAQGKGCNHMVHSTQRHERWGACDAHEVCACGCGALHTLLSGRLWEPHKACANFWKRECLFEALCMLLITL